MPHLIAPTISTQLRRTAIVVSIASAAMLAAVLANRLSPGGSLAPRQLAGAVDWNGWIAGTPDGTYTFAVPAGGLAQLAVDGRVVADGTTSTPIHLDATPRVFDFQDRRAGPHALSRTADGPDVAWSRDGGEASEIPRSLLFARKPRAIALMLASALRAFEAASEWIWVCALVASAFAMAATVWTVRRVSIASDVDWRPLRWIVIGSIVLNLIPIWWGLPAIWPPDELSPTTLLRAIDAHFANGWFERWPPLHYYVLTIAMSPVLLLNALGRIDYSSGAWPQVIIVIDRLVSVAAAGGTVIAAALVTSRVFGRRAGLFAAAIFALAVPFPYYAKTANLDVPYLFWFAVSLVFYFRVFETWAVRDAVCFAAFATLAVCTKDQAYALYPLMMLAIAVRAWEGRRFAPVVGGVVTAVVMFALCHNLLFNWGGFVEHVRFIVGPGSENYRMFPPTIAGRLALLRLTFALIKNSWGWPLTIVCMAGLVHAALIRRCLPAWALLLPAISYYFGFVNIILYNYDRFVMPMTLILAMFGGYALDKFAAIARPRALRVAGVAIVFAYSLLYAATVDALMLRDSRYVVRRWASERLQSGEAIGISGPRELEPAFTVPYLDIVTRTDLQRLQPAYYVLSADYARAVPLETEWGQLIAALQAGSTGYALIARVRCSSPWPWLPDAHPELVGPRPITPGGDATSVLRDVNPTLEIYSRAPATIRAPLCH